MNISNKKLFFLIILMIIISTGCATNQYVGSLSSDQRARIASIVIIHGATTRSYTVLGTVKGISCNRNAYRSQQLTEAEAIEGVKLRAASFSADAVVNLVCQANSGADWVNNCFSSIVCIGDAVQYKN